MFFFIIYISLLNFLLLINYLKNQKSKFYSIYLKMNPIENELDTFKYLISKNCTKANQNDLLKRAKGPFINKICECILNIIEGRVKISKQDLEKLKPYKNLFRKLVNKKLKIKEKKKLIIQKGGFLQILIPAIISGLATIISSVISRPELE